MIKIRLEPALAGRRPADLAVLFQFKGDRRPAGGADAALGRRLGAGARHDRFRCAEGESFLWHAQRGQVRRWLLIGLGERRGWSAYRLQRACRRVAARARRLGAQRLSLAVPHTPEVDLGRALERMTAALAVAAVRFDKYRSTPDPSRAPRRVDLCLGTRPRQELRRAVRRGLAEARAILLARELVNEPGGALPPRALAERARAVARSAGLLCRVFDERELRRRGMGAILGVGGGSHEPPRLIHLRYRPKGRVRGRIALVGKGITFDSGGLSLKPAASMEDMKSDKAGAAAVLGVLSVLPELGLPLEVHGVLASAENMPGGRAIRPGDVVRTFSGRTVEVLNTDAEGRLVLADALAYASRLGVDEMVDVATLTGACMVALGALVAGVMGNRPEVIERLRRAAQQAGEKVWELPLVEEYREQLKSSIADLRNTGDRYGGAIIGGLFLEHFVDKKVGWAHMDIAGPAFEGKGRDDSPKGATGTPVATLLRYLELATEAPRGTS